MPGKAFRSSLLGITCQVKPSLVLLFFISCRLLLLLVGCWFWLLGVCVSVDCFLFVIGCRVVADCWLSGVLLSMVVLVPGFPLSVVGCWWSTVAHFSHSWCPSLLKIMQIYSWLNYSIFVIFGARLSFLLCRIHLTWAGLSGTQITVTYSKVDTRSLCDLVFHPISIIYWRLQFSYQIFLWRLCVGDVRLKVHMRENFVWRMFYSRLCSNINIL